MPVDSEEDEFNKFKEAYEIAGGGRPYVYIHKIRKILKWSTGRFDLYLEDLSDEGIIVLQGGNPENLTENEKEESYNDEFGYLRLTVSWIN